MEKKNTSPTVAEQKQILETCVHKLEEVNACILAMYPTLFNQSAFIRLYE